MHRKCIGWVYLGVDWTHTRCTRSGVQFGPAMPTFSLLSSGKWRVQVRRRGLYRNATFDKKSEARDWAAIVESQATHVAAGGFAPVPKNATVADLIEKYVETTKAGGKTKTATLEMLKREIGATPLARPQRRNAAPLHR